jgi:two-component system, NarL family, response regulator DevR
VRVTQHSASERIRVFLLDDNEMILQALKDRLDREPDIEVVGVATRAAAARTMVAGQRPDVAVLDVQLPDGDGVSVCRDIRSETAGTACLMLTGYQGDEALVGAIMAGAAGYVMKHNFADQLVGAVRTVAAGGSALDAEAAQRAMSLVRERLGAAPGPELTGADSRILALIGQGLTDRQIAHRLSVPEQTVKEHISSLLGKLGLPEQRQAVRH